LAKGVLNRASAGVRAGAPGQRDGHPDVPGSIHSSQERNSGGIKALVVSNSVV